MAREQVSSVIETVAGSMCSRTIWGSIRQDADILLARQEWHLGAQRSSMFVAWPCALEYREGVVRS
jgi:hypothetical protein